MRLFIFIIFLWQCASCYSQQGNKFALVYCEEIVSETNTNYGADIIGYYQLLDTSRANPQGKLLGYFNENYPCGNPRIAKINTLLRLWHRYSYEKEHHGNIIYKKYEILQYIEYPFYYFLTPEDSMLWLRNVASFGNKRILVRDTLAFSNTFLQLRTNYAAMSQNNHNAYVAGIINDSMLFICLRDLRNENVAGYTLIEE